MGTGYCDYRKVQLLLAARRNGMAADYVWIFVQINRELEPTVTVCAGELLQYTDMFVNNNVLLVS